MKKTLVTAIFTCAMALFGFAASNPAPQAVSLDGSVFSSNVSKSLSILAVSPSEGLDLASDLSRRAPEDKVFGFKRGSGEGGFVSLADAIADVETVNAPESARVSVISLGTFSENETFQFGYATEDGKDFEPLSVTQAKSSDSSYYSGYNPDSFYQLDFAEDPFNGMIEIYIMGEPLPAPAVTLLVALAAGALFLLYKNRRQRSIQTEQA